MLRFAQVYKNKDVFSEYLKQCNVASDVTCLVKIFTSVLDKDSAVQVASEIKDLLPNAQIAGATSAKVVVIEGHQLEFETIVLIEIYQKLNIKIETFSWEDKSVQKLAVEVHNTFSGEDMTENTLVNIIFTDDYYDINEFVLQTNDLFPTVKLVGGIAGDLLNIGAPGYVFTDKGYIEKGAIAFCAIGDDAHNFYSVSNSMEKIGPVHEITKTNESILEEIDGESAYDWICEYLELAEDQKISSEDWGEIAEKDYLTHFPLMISNTESSGRYLKYDKEANKFSLYFSRLRNGTKFQMGYVNPAKTIQDSIEVCNKILETPVEHIFTYSCLFRLMYLKNCAKWEILPFEKYNVCGIFMMGEIAYDGEKNVFHNGASVFTGIAENERYVIPNLLALENTTLIEDDESFYSIVRAKGKSLFQRQSSKLIGQIENIEKANSYNNTHSLDSTFGIPTVYQYEEDCKNCGLKKLCVIEIITADNTIASVGLPQYYTASKEIFADALNVLNYYDGSKHIKIYSFNYKTFILSANDDMHDDDFSDVMYKLYENFEYATSKETGISNVARFAMVLQQKNMLEAGLNALIEHKDTQDNFIVAAQKANAVPNFMEEKNVIDLLNSAIEKNWVIPYYQGIYNNNTGKIDKYEALMRIIDDEGKVYSPFIFMDISKKYKFYNRISQMMIEKVLHDFEDRDETVSINVSMYDIQSSVFNSWLVNRLKSYSNPEKIIIEFVETENYQSLETLFDFVGSIRDIGGKIAVDDFGAGYSTFSTIVSLSPDFIKIDGSIIAKIVNNNKNLVILNTIKHLAEQMNTQTVAEFVENSEIQDIVKEYGVTHSQGYYFSKPLPINEIDT